MSRLPWVVAVAGATVLAAAVTVYSGSFNVAADSPHWNATARVIVLMRDRSIAVRAAGQSVPNLADPKLIAMGAEHYSEMCTGCHLAPGIPDTEIRRGLYPVPPDLSRGSARSPAEQFWIIKHGIKMSAMPAWGTSHDDGAIWGLVAFIRQLPALDASAYAALTGQDPAATMNPDLHDSHEHVHSN